MKTIAFLFWYQKNKLKQLRNYKPQHLTTLQVAVVREKYFTGSKVFVLGYVAYWLLDFV